MNDESSKYRVVYAVAADGVSDGGHQLYTLHDEPVPMADNWRLVDPSSKPSQAVGDGVVEPKWPGPWNGHRFPVDAIAEVFGKAAFEASSVLRLGAPNHVDIGMALLRQLGNAGFGICRDTPRPAIATPAEVTDEMVAVNRADLEALLECNRAAAQETTMSHSGIDFIEERGGAEAEDVIDRVAYHLYYSLFPAMRIRESLESALTAQCQVSKDGRGVEDVGRLAPVAEPYTAEVVAEVISGDGGENRLSFVIEGGVTALEPGVVLYEIGGLPMPDDGATELYASPSAGAVVPEGWKLVPVEPTAEIIAGAAAAAWPTASKADVDLAMVAARILLQTNMEAAAGASLTQIAASIATMAPAYRAMIASAPEVHHG